MNGAAWAPLILRIDGRDIRIAGATGQFDNSVSWDLTTQQRQWADGLTVGQQVSVSLIDPTQTPPPGPGTPGTGGQPVQELPRGPLKLALWTDRSSYRPSEQLCLYRTVDPRRRRGPGCWGGLRIRGRASVTGGAGPAGSGDGDAVHGRNLDSGPDRQPRSHPLLANVTLTTAPPWRAGKGAALRLQAGSALTATRLLVLGFSRSAALVADPRAAQLFQDGTSAVTDSIQFRNLRARRGWSGAGVEFRTDAALTLRNADTDTNHDPHPKRLQEVLADSDGEADYVGRPARRTGSSNGPCSGPSPCTTCGSGPRMRTSPAPRAGPAVDRWLGPALRTAVATAVLAAGTAAWAESGQAGGAPRGDDRQAGPGNATVVDLQRQVNELRSDLLDERERRIERRQEANGLVLVFLGIAIGIGGLWTYANGSAGSAAVSSGRRGRAATNGMSSCGPCPCSSGSAQVRRVTPGFLYLVRSPIGADSRAERRVQACR